MPIEIKLTSHELMQSGLVGVMRRVSSLKEGYNKNKHAEKSDWATDIDGAAAEQAVARWLGGYWSGHVRSFKAPDVGVFQVRSSNHKVPHLILRGNDDPQETYLLVAARPPVYTIIGFLLAAEGMADQYWRPPDHNGGGAWWVPQSALRLIGP